MSATSHLFEAALGDATVMSKDVELIHVSGTCGTLEPRWWVVDIGVRARVFDTSSGAIVRPGLAEFGGKGFASVAPLHLRISAGLLDGRVGSHRSWLIDATSTRTYLFASSLAIHLLGPDSLQVYADGGQPSQTVARDVFVKLLTGVWPCDTRYRQGFPGVPARGSNCSIRVRVPAGSTDVAVLIPDGARTLAIFDASGSSSPWTWQLGDDPSERVGRISVFDGQTVDTALVPNFSRVAPAAAFAADRDVLLVFGVDL